MIRGITFSEQAFYSADFAHYQNFFMNKKNGITKGCEITQDGAQITIGTGYFLVQGRMMNVETETVVTSSSGFEDGYNRLVYTIDLSKTNTVSEFNQGYLEVLHDETLVQEDLEAGGLKYQYALCNFQWNGSAISSFNIDAASINLENIFAEIEANWEVIKAEQEQWFADNKVDVETWFAAQRTAFEEFFDAQEADILRMIEELKNQGFASYTDFQALSATVAGKAETETYSGTLPVDGWTDNTGYFTKAVTVAGILATDEPILDLVTTTAGFEAEQEAWGLVFKAETSADTITFYASEVPATEVNFTAKVVR